MKPTNLTGEALALFASIEPLLENDLPYADDQLWNYTSWQRFVEKPPVRKPIMPTPSQWNNLDSSAKTQFDQARKIYHSSFDPIPSQPLKTIVQEVVYTTWDNLRLPPGARSGFILDGLGTLGKSTILMQIGRTYEQMVRARYVQLEARPAALFIPVCYVRIPAATTPKKLLSNLCVFHGIPKAPSENDLKNAFREHVKRCKTSLILVDDIHNLQRGNKNAESVNDLLKELMDDVPATLVYAGINCQQTVLLTDPSTGQNDRFTQTEQRFIFHHIDPFPYDVGLQKESQWLTLLASFERHLCLRLHNEGTLPKLALYMYMRTAGGIGALRLLIRQAANLAIREGVESITCELMDRVTLGYAAEQYYREMKIKVKNIRKPSEVAELLSPKFS